MKRKIIFGTIGVAVIVVSIFVIVRSNELDKMEKKTPEEYVKDMNN